MNPMKEMLNQALHRSEPSVTEVKVEEGEDKGKLMLTDKQIPQLKDWSVGKTYSVTLTIKQVEMKQEDGCICAEFTIESVDSAKPVKEKAEAPKEEKPTEKKPEDSEDPMVAAYKEENS